jgi:iron complex outermembrane receptor protein
MKHLVRADVELFYRKWLGGISFRYNSFMKNIDKIFLDLDRGLLVTGITEWREENSKGDYVFDLRLGYDIGKHGRITLVIDNLLNRAYTIRPLKIEKNRTVSLQYAINF